MASRRAVVIMADGSLSEMPAGDTLAADQVPGSSGGAEDPIDKFLGGYWQYSLLSCDLAAKSMLYAFLPGAAPAATVANGALPEAGSQVGSAGSGAGLSRVANQSFVTLTTGTTATGNTVVTPLQPQAFSGSTAESGWGTYGRKPVAWASKALFSIPLLSNSTQRFTVRVNLGPLGGGPVVELYYSSIVSSDWYVQYLNSAGFLATQSLEIPVVASEAYNVSCKARKLPSGIYEIRVYMTHDQVLTDTPALTITDSWYNNVDWQTSLVNDGGISFSVRLMKFVGTTARTLNLSYQGGIMVYEDLL
jgi:hypothetical protein